MVNKELEDERKELLDLAERVGYLDSSKLCGETLKTLPINISSLPDLTIGTLETQDERKARRNS